MASYFSNSDRSGARVVVVGIPFDRTSSFIPGSRFGPEIGRLGTANIESYSPYQDRDLTAVKIYDMGDLNFSFDAPNAVESLIKSTTREVYRSGKRMLAVGGEHTITPWVISELNQIFPELCVIQFDAHSDLREEFLGERVCHATAMRRTLDHIPRERLFQLGIRSFALPEEIKLPNVFPFEILAPLERIRPTIGNRPVYLTVDLDVLDPGVMPDVATPQPGGCSYRELCRAFAQLARLNVIGADIVEYCPRENCVPFTASLVAELVRELILLLSP